MNLEDIHSLFRGIQRRYSYTIHPDIAPSWLAEANRAWVWNGNVAWFDIAKAVKDFHAGNPTTPITPHAITAIIRSYYGARPEGEVA
ncbi:hypothetical protein IU449_26720 [Nocardia higoensis]|uniref:Uncharacterized protein n=1 Tax=Nocardia higoensis TaxID=228599 RepID=A0ABS0DN04_9NOCA|nr:hypothetical protein [Nocardia higoensis]MBF6358093.1 hypothetical protein [Nocardia higoensis]